MPPSLRQIAATNPPAVSSILWEQFLDDNKPQWFLDLPSDIQSYLIVEYGPETAWPTASSSTSAESTPTSNSASKTSTPSASSSTTSSFGGTRSSSAAASATSGLDAPPATVAGLTRQEKIKLGLGIPLGLLGAAAVLLTCCFFYRRRKNKRRINGLEPPSSPGFIPRSAFHEKTAYQPEHRAPLNSSFNRSSQNLGSSHWSDEEVDSYDRRNHPYEPATLNALHRASVPPATAAAPMSMHDSTPVMAPVVFHTHSSNRARGRRTSYTSLHSVAELTEPDDHTESPVLGRHTTPLQRKRRPSMPMVLELPPSVMASAPRSPPTLKRKPIPESPMPMIPAADAASQSLLRPGLAQALHHSGSSSSGVALSSTSSGSGNYGDRSSTVSPISDHPVPPKNPFRDSQTYVAYSPGTEKNPPKNPFSNDYSYVEDYGPEYQGGYVDHEDSRDANTEWPLVSTRERRERSPMWDRVYESP
jgi:hypothetical protein